MWPYYELPASLPPTVCSCEFAEGFPPRPANALRSAATSTGGSTRRPGGYQRLGTESLCAYRRVDRHLRRSTQIRLCRTGLAWFGFGSTSPFRSAHTHVCADTNTPVWLWSQQHMRAVLSHRPCFLVNDPKPRLLCLLRLPAGPRASGQSRIPCRPAPF